MIKQQTDDIERKEAAILKVLSDSPRPLGSRVLARRLGDMGIDLGERAVRYHLKLMDERGLTRFTGRKDGRSITSAGIEELGSALVTDRLGLVISRIGTLAYQSSFEPRKRQGEVPVNLSMFPRKDFYRAVAPMKEVFSAGFGNGDLVKMAPEREKLGVIIVPPGQIALATVSHIALCGAWLRAGIPVEFKFGGVLQIQNGRALRFIELIDYASCSLDPSEVFIASGMTSVFTAASEGNGRILACFCEIPAIARTRAEAIIKELETADIRSLVILGKIGEPICQLPVAPNRAGVVISDALNPVAAAVEAGFKVTNHTMSGIIEFGKLEHFSDCLLPGR